jgi:hypothetical protein
MTSGHVACMGEMRNAYKFLFRRAEGKIPLVWLRHKGRIIPKWILKI